MYPRNAASVHCSHPDTWYLFIYLTETLILHLSSVYLFHRVNFIFVTFGISFYWNLILFDRLSLSSVWLVFTPLFKGSTLLFVTFGFENDSFYWKLIGNVCVLSYFKESMFLTFSIDKLAFFLSEINFIFCNSLVKMTIFIW